MVEQVSQSYATVSIPALKVQPGCFIAGRLSFIGMKLDTSFKLDPSGVDLTARFNTTEFSRVGLVDICRQAHPLQAALGASSGSRRGAQCAVHQLGVIGFPRPADHPSVF